MVLSLKYLFISRYFVYFPLLSFHVLKYKILILSKSFSCNGINLNIQVTFLKTLHPLLRHRMPVFLNNNRPKFCNHSNLQILQAQFLLINILRSEETRN